MSRSGRCFLFFFLSSGMIQASALLLSFLSLVLEPYFHYECCDLVFEAIGCSVRVIWDKFEATWGIS